MNLRFPKESWTLGMGTRFGIWSGVKKVVTPVFVIHGGPVSESMECHKTLFDPKKHPVVFLGQCGCGKSVPRLSLKDNTS